MEMRQGVYYLSVAAAGFLVFIIVLAIIKYIIFVLLFIGSAGKLKFWIFPNLTEDVGFLKAFGQFMCTHMTNLRKKSLVMMKKAQRRKMMMLKMKMMARKMVTVKEVKLGRMMTRLKKREMLMI